MARRIIVGSAIGLGLLAASAAPAFAETTDLQSQIQSLMSQISQLAQQLDQLRTQALAPLASSTPSTVPALRYPVCALLQRNLSQGTEGDDVASLQTFLHNEGFLAADATGFFGPLTVSALMHWQASQGVVASGDARTTGWGAVGPLTRSAIARWCGQHSSPPSCTPQTYTPVACSDGSQSQPTRDAQGCITGYECPVSNFTPPATCKVWNDGCNECSRQTPTSDAMCTQRACFAAGKGYCSVYFGDTNSNQPPVVSGVSGPTTLDVGATGTWTVNASDPENGQLVYSVVWGDESFSPLPMLQALAGGDVFTQTSTFTHSYAHAGIYTIYIGVRDNTGLSARTSTTVRVGTTDAACTEEYDPVCGQPAEPACRHSVPACMIATPGPQTYGNRCMMNAAGATFLYEGQCRSTTVACTMDAMRCHDGSYVGRSGPNCQFVCPTTSSSGSAKPLCTQQQCMARTADNSAFCDNSSCPTGARTGASCALGATAYANGQSVSTLTWCQQNGPCSLGLNYSAEMTCSNGQWVSSLSQTVGSNPNTACTFSNTPEMSQCGGLYHCGAGANGAWWQATPCPAAL